MLYGSRLIEWVFNVVFRALSRDEEWQGWHARTMVDLDRIRCGNHLPKELVDLTEVKYYSWLSDEILSVVGVDLGEILEVGCGSGALSLQLQIKTNADCIVLDNEVVALEYASFVFSKRKATFVQGSAIDLPFEDNLYGLVHSVGLIEHFSDEVVLRMISEMKRVTRPGGFIYLAVPNYFSPDLMMLWWKHRKGSERYMTTGLLTDYLDQEGLEIIDFGHSGFSFGGAFNDLFPVTFEKLLGRLGFGFLNYAIAKKVS